MNAPEQLAFPPIEADPPPSTALAPLSIKDAVLVQFKAAETEVKALAERYTGVAYDCKTTKGMAEAKAARMELRERGRYAVTRAEAKVKGEVNDLKRLMTEEVERIVAIVRPVEDAIDAQIKAEEERKEAEKREKERIAAERRAKFDFDIAAIRSYVQRAAGLPAYRIANGIKLLEGMVLAEADWAEFLAPAQQAQAETLAKLREMHEHALVFEENERLRAELAARAPAPAVETPPPASPPADAPVDPQTGEILTGAVKVTEGSGSQQVLKAEAATPDATDRETPADASPVGGPMGAGQPAAAGPVGEDQRSADPVKLGDICAWTGITMTAAFVTDTLRIQPSGKVKAAVLFDNKYAVRDALVAHLKGLQ